MKKYYQRGRLVQRPNQNGLSIMVKIFLSEKEIGVKSVPYTLTNQDYFLYLPFNLVLLRICGMLASWIGISNLDGLFAVVNISSEMKLNKNSSP